VSNPEAQNTKERTGHLRSALSYWKIGRDLLRVYVYSRGRRRVIICPRSRGIIVHRRRRSIINRGRQCGPYESSQYEPSRSRAGDTPTVSAPVSMIITPSISRAPGLAHDRYAHHEEHCKKGDDYDCFSHLVLLSIMILITSSICRYLIESIARGVPVVPLLITL
jgi:hypothetical protein